jgi:hypothetical protein
MVTSTGIDLQHTPCCIAVYGSYCFLKLKWIVLMLKGKGEAHRNRGILRISLSAKE